MESFFVTEPKPVNKIVHEKGKQRGTEHGMGLNYLEWAKIESERLDRIVFRVEKRNGKYITYFNTIEEVNDWITLDAPSFPEDYVTIKRRLDHKINIFKRSNNQGYENDVCQIEATFGRVVK